MCVQLDLAGTIDDQVIILVPAQLVIQPIEVIQEIPILVTQHILIRGPTLDPLEAVDEAAVGPELELLHDVLQVDQVPDIDGGFVFESLGGRVEVEEVDGTPDGLGVGDEGGAKGGFTGTGGTGDEDGVPHVVD